jgi:hypothetical protein
MHDNIKDDHWAFWLIGKGFTARGRIILEQLLKGETCLDQTLLYYPNSSVVRDEHGDPYGDSEGAMEEMYERDVDLWAEFLTSSPIYITNVMSFLIDEELDNAEQEILAN